MTKKLYFSSYCEKICPHREECNGIEHAKKSFPDCYWLMKGEGEK